MSIGERVFDLSRRQVLSGLTGLAVVPAVMRTAGRWLDRPSFDLSGAEPRVDLVSTGQAVAVIVNEEPSSALVVEAVEVLQHVVERASGARLRVVGPGEPFSEPAAVRVGRGPRAGAVLANAGITLQKEEFWTSATANEVIVVGADADPGAASSSVVTRTPATLWGVQRLLDDWLGVRWLWPGEAGTVVPHSLDIAIGDHEGVHRPALLTRQLRNQLTAGHLKATNKWLTTSELAKLNAEYFRWAETHHMGAREAITARHSFGTWWGRFGSDHPDWFAEPPAGSDYEQPWPQPDRVKLRLSNPDVADQIIADWRAAGRPATYAVTPNDSTGFDTSPATMAMDYPLNQAALTVWAGKGKLATRYVKFWNSLLTRMRCRAAGRVAARTGVRVLRGGTTVGSGGPGQRRNCARHGACSLESDRLAGLV